MRSLIFSVGFFIMISAYGQLTLRSIPINKARDTKLTGTSTIKQNTLPFWDDFSITPDGLPDSIKINGSDTTRQWDILNSEGVFVNATLATNPPSYKVITFDGLDENGQIYAEGNGLTDELYSNYLDLSAFTEADDIVLSFYWQGGGNVEQPEDKDSIHLEFYNKTTKRWEWIWSKSGAEIPSTSTFYQEGFKLKQKYISDSTQFRFQAFGDQDGPFDAWHLDWIFMNNDRAGEDFFYFDRGLTGQLTSPFSPFKSLPVHQFKNLDQDLQIGSQNFQGFNLEIQEQLVDYTVEIRNLNNGSLLSESSQVAVILPSNADPKIISNVIDLNFPSIDLTTLPFEDSIVIGSFAYANTEDDIIAGTNINARVNDTIRVEYLLHDFYSFDDGTAEYAVGTNRQGNQVGVQYWVNVQDTISQVDIYFPNIHPDSNGETLILKVFKELENNRPVYTESITIQTAQASNQFTSYVLARPVIVSDTFYVAYEQNVNQYISIGLDRSNDEASQYIFENVTGEWTRNERIKGALMIRPVFKDIGEYTLGLEGQKKVITSYPNPTNGVIFIKGDYEQIELRNLSGQLLVREKVNNQHDFSHLPKGIYLLSIFNGNAVQTQKIIIE